MAGRIFNFYWTLNYFFSFEVVLQFCNVLISINSIIIEHEFDWIKIKNWILNDLKTFVFIQIGLHVLIV